MYKLISLQRARKRNFESFLRESNRKRQFSTSSICSSSVYNESLFCKYTDEFSLARVGHRVCRVGRNTRSRAASKREDVNWNSTARCRPTSRTHFVAILRPRKAARPTMAVRPRFMRCRNCTLFLGKIYGIGVVQVSDILGIGLPPRHRTRHLLLSWRANLSCTCQRSRSLWCPSSRARTHHYLPLYPGGR